MPETTQSDVFLGALNGFLAGEPRLGCRKLNFRFLSGYSSGNQKSTFLHPRKVPPSGRVPCPLFLRPERPLPLPLPCYLASSSKPSPRCSRHVIICWSYQQCLIWLLLLILPVMRFWLKPFYMPPMYLLYCTCPC